MMGGNHRDGKAALEFTEMMETLTSSGLSIQESLVLIAASDKEATSGKEVASGKEAASAGEAAQAILSAIRKGASFAGALSALEKVFSPFYRGMIALGDRAGSVERIFPRLALFLRERKALREKSASALAYPVLVLFAALAFSIVLAVFVLPGLENVFSAIGQEGPGGTGAGERVRRNIALIRNGALALAAVLGGFAAAVGIFRLSGVKRESRAELFDRILLRLPLAGPFIISRETLNFCFAMETLAAGGVSLETALGEAGGVISNRRYRAALEEARETVINGGSLQAAFTGAGIFPAYFCRWIAVGESAGKSGEIFSRIRSWFQAEIDRKTGRFLLLIEPLLIILTGALVMGLVAAIVLPLFEAYGSLF